MAFQGHAQLEGKSEKEATGQLQELLKLRVRKKQLVNSKNF